MMLIIFFCLIPGSLTGGLGVCVCVCPCSCLALHLEEEDVFPWTFIFMEILVKVNSLTPSLPG